MEANFSAFFGLSVQAYEVLTIPDHTPFDQFLGHVDIPVEVRGVTGHHCVVEGIISQV